MNENEPSWVSGLRTAITSARVDRVRDEHLRWKFDRILSEGQPRRERRAAPITLAGIVDIVVTERDDAEQPPILVTIPIRNQVPQK